MCLYKCVDFLWGVTTLYERAVQTYNVPVQKAYDYYPETTNTQIYNGDRSTYNQAKHQSLCQSTSHNVKHAFYINKYWAQSVRY